jgi:hypothetical protein
MMAHNDEAAGAAITRGHCPDCDYRGFVLGPRGGAAINIECGNPQCRARFNVTTYCGVVIFCERIAREADGGSRWGQIVIEGDRITVKGVFERF